MRYALYFTPAEHDPLTEAASRWLGRDAFSGAEYPAPDDAELPAGEITRLTADPRRYGFHATLKAPFKLKDNVSEAELLDAVERFAAETPMFEIPRIVVGQLGHFFALVPASLHPPLQDFAAAVVEEFEPFRAPLSEADIARRKPEKLTLPQRENLSRWGYPYVMEEFRFHMTLTGPVEPELAGPMRQKLDRRFAAFANRPLSIDGLAVFIETERGAPFTIHSRLPLAPALEHRKTAP